MVLLLDWGLWVGVVCLMWYGQLIYRGQPTFWGQLSRGETVAKQLRIDNSRVSGEECKLTSGLPPILAFIARIEYMPAI